MKVRTENSLLLRQELQPLYRPPSTGLRIKRGLKTGVATLVWLVGGLAVITYGAALVYANVARVEIDSAIVAGVVEAATAPIAGRLQSNLFAGAPLKGGERLFEVVNPTIEENISLAAVRVDRAKSELKLKTAERDSERARRDSFLAALKAEIGRTRAEVEAFNDLEKSAQRRFQAATDLFGKGFVTRLRLEDTADKLAESKSNRIRGENRFEEKTALFAAVTSGRAYGSVEGLGRLADAEAAVRRAESEVTLSAEELRVQMERRTEARFSANSAGRVLRVLKLHGTAVQPGDAVALIEREGDRILYAFLTQEEVGRVSVDDVADVVLPAQHLTARARVVAVERSGGYLDDVETRYIWKLARDPGVRHTDRDRTARVTLRFSNEDQAIAKRELSPGTPAFVSFQRRWDNSKVVAAYTTLEQLASRTMDRLASAQAAAAGGGTTAATE